MHIYMRRWHKRAEIVHSNDRDTMSGRYAPVIAPYNETSDDRHDDAKDDDDGDGDDDGDHDDRDDDDRDDQ